MKKSIFTLTFLASFFFALNSFAMKNTKETQIITMIAAKYPTIKCFQEKTNIHQLLNLDPNPFKTTLNDIIQKLKSEKTENLVQIARSLNYYFTVV